MSTPARILIVEDNETNLELMVYLLRAFGYAPLTASDGEQGVELALRERPDLVVCDIQLPGIDGREVVRRLKSAPATRNTPVVAVTALAMVGDRDKLLAAGFDDYISKPIEPERFVAQIEAALHPDLHAPENAGPPADPPSAQPPATVPLSAHADILVVDDTPANRDYLRTMLEATGYSVRLAEGVTEAYAAAQESTPDLVLSDLHMHPDEGTELISLLRADDRFSGVPVVILSLTSSHYQARDECLARGAHSFLQLPVEPPQLLAHIAAALGARQ